MRVKLLALPRWGGIPNFFPSLALATLSSHLKRFSFKVSVDDLHIRAFHHNKTGGNPIDFSLMDDGIRLRKFCGGEDDGEILQFCQQLLSQVDIGKGDVIGLSVPEPHEHSALLGDAVARVIKEHTDADVVVGGEIYQMLDFFVASDNVDYVVPSSEGEAPLLRLLERLEAGKDVSEKLISTKRQPSIQDGHAFRTDCEEFPLPDYSESPLDLYRLRYNIPGIGGKPILLLPYRFVKNCLANCAFCMASASPYCVANDPSQVAEDLRILKRKYRTSDFVFFNTQANVSDNYTLNLIKAFKEQDLAISWIDCLSLINLNPVILSGLREVGLRKAIFGLESASEGMLKYIRKPINLNAVHDLLCQAQREGVWTEVELIAGLPHETDKDVQVTIDFIRRYEREISIFHLNPFRLVRSQFFLNPQEYNLRIVGGLQTVGASQGYPFDEIGGLGWREKQRQIQDAFHRIDMVIPQWKKKDVPLSFLYAINKSLDSRTDFDTFKSIMQQYGRDSTLDVKEVVSLGA